MLEQAGSGVSGQQPSPFRPATVSAEGRDRTVGGPWVLVEEGFGETRVIRIHLTLTGASLSGHTGTAGRPGSSWLEGKFEDGEISLKRLSLDRKHVLRTYVGTAADGALHGRARWNDLEYEWAAHRPPERPAGARVATVDFAPDHYHRVVTASHRPALRIFPGDTVRTSTLDSTGVDQHSVQRTVGGNPVIGPVHVTGAVPGDTLAVHLTRVRPNRAWARGASGLVPEALTPEALRGRALAGGRDRLWRLDLAANLARLDAATDALAAFAVPLRPMLGYIGTAPAGSLALSTRDAGPHGGNLDCSQIGEGATVCLPVLHEGGLLFLGDGHAAQGDGELSGDALETSLDLEFVVDVLPGRPCVVPRVETADGVAAIGAGGSLDQALRSATSGLLAWLEYEYRLSTAESSLVVGCAIDYQVAALSGTHACVAARLPRSILERLTPARSPH